ncbi:MAG: molybdopterin molybdotransferase MoeA, partial [Gammaproteobacteria bacterium]|nr:molybdopterin molybdotransferase MoeA [Gammaproteobacteria bacterium]
MVIKKRRHGIDAAGDYNTQQSGLPMIDKTLISVDEALAIVLEQTHPRGSHRVAITETLGQVLAEDILSQRIHPPWNNSAMDGYAVQWNDIKNTSQEHPVKLKIIGEVQAGAIATLPVNAGEAMQIMTGAPVPKNADTVVRVEHSKQTGDFVHIFSPGKSGDNIRLKGEDIQLGSPVISAHTLIRPAEIGLLATAGYVWATVYKKPFITILATGDELAEPGDHLSPEKIINSNTFSIAAQTTEAGGQAQVLKTAKDNKVDLEAKIKEALQADIALIIGGISIGHYDLVKEVLQDLGCKIKFWRVNMRPGHPLAFGVLSNGTHQTLLFALPGNPVSCMVAFYQFTLPAIRKMRGLTQNLTLPQVDAIVQQNITNRPGRRHFARAITTYHDGHYHVRLTG